METLQNENPTLDRDELLQALEGLGYLAEAKAQQATIKTHAAAPAADLFTEAVNQLRASFGWDQHGRVTENTRRAIHTQVSALQRKLATQDCYDGLVDGRFDDATREALKRFQGKHASTLAETGILDPATRQVLAGLPPYTFDEVLCSELDAVNQGREQMGQNQETEAAESGNALVRAHQARLLGLAFSGGGIRSATFNLGILQGLARLGLLHRVDYLSTVSGGGYIGSWLHAWVNRQDGDVRKVEEKLAVKAGETAHEPYQVTWLRQYSNYLTPRVGLLSADTMTGVATWLRNVLLNQFILGALGLLVLSLPWLALMLAHSPAWREGPASLVVAGAGALLVLLAAYLGARETGAIESGIDFSKATPGPCSPAPRKTMAPWVIGMAGAAALLLGVAVPFAVLNAGIPGWQAAAALGLLQAVLFLLGWCMGFRNTAPQNAAPPTNPHAACTNKWAMIAALIGGAVLAALMAMLMHIADAKMLEQAQGRLLLVVLGPPGVLLALLLAATAQIGMAGRKLREPAREWWSRTGGILISALLGWLALAGVALLGSYGVSYMDAWITVMGGIVWLATTVAGVALGRSPSTGNGKEGWKNQLTILAPWVFIVGLLVALSVGLHTYVIWTGQESKTTICTPSTEASKPTLRAAYEIDLAMKEGILSGKVASVKSNPGCDVSAYASQADRALAKSQAYLFGLIGGLALLAWLLGRRVDINVFAFHMFYRNRLERCYMGASNPKSERHPHPFTGLDPKDSPTLADLKHKGKVQRPYPLINTALNIAHSKNLAWQERKAASFLFTPEFCGYQFPGTKDAGVSAYQKTDQYLTGQTGGRQGWLALGTPITISGAAASPNAGYHTNPATAFLMTVFNVRLGWWIQNTRKLDQWLEPGPMQSIPYLLKELLASTNDEDDYVYVSDGGHFENLGIYELVRRRCRYIIACDAGCDPGCTFEDLGNAIRKCRIDLGIEIEIDPGAIVPDSETGHSLFHCAVGTIHYERRDPVATPGYLLYIKASLTGNEPTDVKQYKSQHDAFPHESTGDQWYSESQFESYRKLGHHVAMQVLAQAREDAAQRSRALAKQGLSSRDLPCDQELLFHALSEQWYPPSSAGRSSFSTHGAELEKIYDRMRLDRNLHFLDAQIYPEWVKLAKRVELGPQKTQRTMLPITEDELRAGFYLCNTLIQLMENVYVDLRLEEEHAHPDNRGWMNLFRHWSWSGMFRVTWAICVATYGARFQQFCRRHLSLENGTLKLAQPIEVGTDKWENCINFLELEHVRRVIVGHYGLEKTKDGESAEDPADVLAALDKEQLAARANAWIGESGRDQLVVQPLEMHVSDPFGIQEDFVFPVGFALVRKPEHKVPHGLVYYRIQDHLRRMGLGRKGLSKLQETFPDMVVDMPPALNRIIQEADPALLQNLWHLVLWATPTEKEQRRI